jgi:2-dehydro-3-deoxyphosphogluconate aldolase/(4S)-4-hydroxy-2-oxoglutarate aldolase
VVAGKADIQRRIADDRIVPVVVIHDSADAAGLAAALRGGGLRQVEITYRTAAASAVIAALRRMAPELLVLAGTVLEQHQLDAAIAAGAQGIVSPAFNLTIIDRAREAGLTIVPGIATATELDRARDIGLELVKVFPAEQLGGVQFLQALNSVYPQMRFMPTGGITLEKLSEYAPLGCVAACGMSSLVPHELLAAARFDEIERRMAEARAAMHPAKMSARK